MSFRTAYGNDYSENGWRMVDRDMCVVANVLPYTNTAPVRVGDAATILNAWLLWYHHNVELLSSPVWGWSATNDVRTSNHLSGTALDINAPRYPWGLRTMPAARIAKVREGLRLFEGSIFWGRDWNRPDEMHYQIGWREGDPRVAEFAAKLNNNHLGIYGPAPAPAPAPTLGESVTPEQYHEIDRKLDLILDQLGPWPQLGKNGKGENLTLVDAVSAIKNFQEGN
ncbi:M15 family metallopeptidase [Rhodococcus xishaensis]|uniref:M15 family peptidase n=1 Tax=Rhodococcus xishaensis TaxID=2487364 RepID=A0A438AWE9_9NOCA|nr:M15 family metallopeptidase [Rhodococcus xishaensis]RVW02999.1 M15 family peptidase [Rhodococcus xishaensis]